MTFYKNKAEAIDEKIWIEYAKTRDIALRNQILNYYLYIVSTNIKRINIPSYCQDVDDLTNQGILELIKCIERYDYTRGIQFDTYASVRIRGCILDYIRKKNWIPQDLRKQVEEMKNCSALFRSENNREPNDDELAELLGIDKDRLNEIRMNELRMNILNFEELIYDSEKNVSEYLYEPDSNRPEEIALGDELKDIIAQCIGELDKNEKTVISLYYYEELKFKEIAFVMNLTPARISQIHTKALGKLKSRISQYLAHT
jgi:RNA polymerase sigma factor for flagellar operon FliA